MRSRVIRTLPRLAAMLAIAAAFVLIDQSGANAGGAGTPALCVATKSPVKIDEFNGLFQMLLQPVRSLFQSAQFTATVLWKSLATLEIAFFLVTTVIQKKGIEEILSGYAYKLLGVFFVLGLITSIGNSGGQLIYGLVVTDMASMGQHAAGSLPQDQALPNDGTAVENVLENGLCAGINIAEVPAELWQQQIISEQKLAQQQAQQNQNPIQKAINIVGGPLQAAGDIISNLLTAIEFIPSELCSLAVGMWVAFMFALLAGELLFVILEGALILGAGLILLGFGASRWTAPIAANYFSYAISVGFKVFALELVVGLGTGMINALIMGMLNKMDTYTAAPPDPSANGTNGAVKFAQMITAGPMLDFEWLVAIVLVAAVIHILGKNVNGIGNALQGAPSMNMGLGHQAVSGAKDTAKAAIGTAAATAAVIATGGAALAGAMRAGGTVGASEAAAGTKAGGDIGGGESKAPNAPKVSNVTSKNDTPSRSAANPPVGQMLGDGAKQMNPVNAMKDMAGNVSGGASTGGVPGDMSYKGTETGGGGDSGGSSQASSLSEEEAMANSGGATNGGSAVALTGGVGDENGASSASDTGATDGAGNNGGGGMTPSQLRERAATRDGLAAGLMSQARAASSAGNSGLAASHRAEAAKLQGQAAGDRASAAAGGTARSGSNGASNGSSNGAATAGDPSSGSGESGGALATVGADPGSAMKNVTPDGGGTAGMQTYEAPDASQQQQQANGAAETARERASEDDLHVEQTRDDVMDARHTRDEKLRRIQQGAMMAARLSRMAGKVATGAIDRIPATNIQKHTYEPKSPPKIEITHS